MIETLVDIDQQLFHIVNEGMANPVLDVLCPIFRNKLTWIPAYVVVAYFFYRWYGIKALALLAMAGITIALSDQISATFIKQHFHRLRPCNNVLMQARGLVPCGGGYSFVSSHAANHFALAMYISLVVPVHLHKKWAAFLFPWAISLGDIGMFGFFSMVAFLAVLTVGFIYEWCKGALEWER